MGICDSVKSSKPKHNQPNSRQIDKAGSNSAKKHDGLVKITNKVNETIIKTINQMNGASLLIENNKQSVIIILDYTSKVMIVNCNQCSIYIAPCSTDILINNCKDIHLISASSNISINNVTTAALFLFAKHSPVIEQSTNITLGLFCLQYTELPDMFHKAKLNIWQNSWSQYVIKDNALSIKTNKTPIAFMNEDNKNRAIKSFDTGQSDIIISFDQYQSHPYQYGKSICDKALQSMNNLLLVFKADFLNDNYKEVLNVFSNEEMRERRTMLLKTNIISDSKREFNQLKEQIMKSSNEYLINYFNSSLRSTSKMLKGNSQFGFTKTYDEINTFKQLYRNEVLVMWLVNDCDNFEELQKYIERSFDDYSIGWIIAEDLRSDEKRFQELLKELVY